ncbi:MAG: TrkA C-terminal domain-containing protein [Clostridia bacterium]|nr:TrkA C-terminal domain-containing protein [Clostridia bacterium]MDD4047393.1 TrkA C-terminal domain-containing protein [Clostridia bacterium]
MQQRVDTGYSRYEQIAIDIAQKIVRGEFRVDQKLSGRSLLAGTYNVSPETIRRSIALLQNIGVVEAVTGSGIIVRSSSLAREYLEEFNERQKVLDLRNRISILFNQRQILETELEKELSKFLEYSFQKSSILQQIEEIILPPESWMAEKTIAETNLRNITETTIAAIKRDGKETFSPPSNMKLESGDVLVIVGTPRAREKLREIIKEKFLS